MINIKRFAAIALVLVFGLIFSSFYPQNNDNDSWKAVESLAKKGQPKSALKLVDNIYNKAVLEKNNPEIIKALIYRVSLQSKFEEDHILNAIDVFKKRIDDAESPEKEILLSLTAELYQAYYNSNRWVVNKRKVVANNDSEDIETWDAQKFNKEISNLYNSSLQNSEMLSAINLKEYQVILKDADSSNFSYFPYLYDLLANRALNYYTSADYELAILGNPQLVDAEKYLVSTPQFIKIEIDPKLSVNEQILFIFQKLINLHIRNNNTEALVDIDLRRLEFTAKNANPTEETTKHYIETLTWLASKYHNNPVYASIAYRLANQYYLLGQNYSREFNTENKDCYVTADSICDIALNNYPNVIGSNKCRNLKERINSIHFNFDMPVSQSPNMPTLALVEFKNINKLYFKIVEGEALENSNRHNLKEYIQRELRKEAIKSWTQELPSTNDHRQHTVEIKIPALEVGYYVIYASDSPDFSTTKTIKYKPFSVTNLSYITNSNPAGEFNDMFILDRQTGKSISDVNITVYRQQYDNKSRSYDLNKVATLSSDKNGYVRINSLNGNNYGTFLFDFQKDSEHLFSENYLNFFRPPVNDKSTKTTYLFTDRAVYRPGQVVYFKAIVTERLSNDINLVENFKDEITLLDANRKKINTIMMTTDDAGSYNGMFTIPMDVLAGNFTLKTINGTIQIKVENYKRPTFEVLFDTLNSQPKPNESVTITGRAIGYAGNAINNSNVKYRVVRKVIFPFPVYRGYKSWFPPVGLKDIEVANGTTRTNKDGSFDIEFVAKADNSIPTKSNPVFTFEVTAEVADITGEIQANSTKINVGNKTLLLDINLPDIIDIEKIENYSVSAKNLNGKNISLEANVEIFKLDPPEELLNDRQWPIPEFNIFTKEQFRSFFPHEVYMDENDPNNWARSKNNETTINIDGSTILPKELFSSLEIGEYLIEATCKDAYGKLIKTKHYFTIMDLSGKKIPGNTINWYALSTKEAQPGDVIKLALGSSAKKSRIMYEVVANNNIVERNWLTVSRGQKVVDVMVNESYRGNFSINLSMVRFNRLYNKTLLISVPYDNKKLDIALETNRSYLIPGKKEEWKVTLKANDGQGIATNLLASMYDQSLDAFYSNDYSLNLYRNNRPASPWRSTQFNSNWSSSLFVPDVKYYQAEASNYPVINWFGYYFSGYNPIAYDQTDMLYRKSVIATESMGANEDNMVADEEIELDSEVELTENEEEKMIVPLRTNFNETAFFYPNLKTDENGNVSFSFETPDALTRWKIQLLAYTNDLKVGTYAKSIETRKKLMVFPNVPRALYQNDTIDFTAKVVNTSSEDMLATTEITFFDAVTMNPINIIIDDNKSVKQFKVPSGQSVPLSWRICIPDSINMLSYKITSFTDNYSDGEERMIPILTNRVLVTNSLPMNVGPSSTEIFNFESLKNCTSPSIRNYKYTIEFTSNPSWYAIQALPVIGKPKNKSTMSLFNMYFANSISAFVLNSNPKIAKVFESWKNHSPDAFLSNLEKNQELKNTVLEATPWLLEAENDSEQKRRIGIMFDVNRMKDEKQTVLTRLINSQLPSGAWPWFNGMKSDKHTTQSIALGMAKLHVKGIIDLKSETRRFQMIRKAVNWLDKTYAENYEDLKKRNPKGLDNYNITASQTQYLYLRSLLVTLMPIPERSTEAINYYTSQAKKYWLKQSNYLQGMTAIMLYKFGYRNESEAIIRSLKERSIFSKEMGMYWRYENGWNWYQSPVETQAMLIETMAVLDNNPTIIEQLKIWLIKQKQTQHWKTTSATAEAIYALLMFGNNSLDNNELLDVTVGGETIDISGNPDISSEAGTGYFTTSWTGNDISEELANISVINPNNNIAWGAAYWQYFEDMDKVVSNKSPLSIKKQLFVEKLTDGGPKLIEANIDSKFKKGDKIIVRLTISSDRTIDYVHLKDMRAAAMEPVSSFSGYTYNGGLWYYQQVTDVSTEFFIQHLSKGTYVVDYPLYITQSGSFSAGIATIQSMYAPEFGANSSGMRLDIE